MMVKKVTQVRGNTPKFSNVYELRDYLMTQENARATYQSLVVAGKVDPSLDRAIKLEMLRAGWGDL